MNVTIKRLPADTDVADLRVHAPWWNPLRNSSGAVVSAVVMCPFGHRGTLEDHTIHADGRVEPSLVCAAEGCDFHVFATLEGWEEQTP